MYKFAIVTYANKVTRYVKLSTPIAIDAKIVVDNLGRAYSIKGAGMDCLFLHELPNAIALDIETTFANRSDFFAASRA